MPYFASVKPAVFRVMHMPRIVAAVSQPEYTEYPSLSAKTFSVDSLAHEASFITITAVASMKIMINSETMNPANTFYWKINNQNGVMAKFMLGMYPSLLKMRSLLRPGTIESGRAW